MAGSIGRGVRVSSWLGTSLLAELVPVTDAQLAETDAQQIPETVTITVPVRDGVTSWDPGTDPRHPLADFGQRLSLIQDIMTPRGKSWSIPLGSYQIQSWTLADDQSTIAVTALGLLQVVADDKFSAPEQPRPDGTFVSEFRRLMSGGIPVSIDPALIDRPCPSGFTWDEDRLGALYDLVDAWPARIATGADGTILVTQPLGVVPDPVLTLTNGQRGVLMTAPRASSRTGRYSVVTATSSADSSTSTPIRGEYETLAGPYAVDTYGVVRERYASPVIGSVAAAVATAQAMAETSQRQARIITVTLPPDARIQRGDAVALVWDGARHLGWVQDVTLPLVVSNTPMTLKVGCPL